MKGCLRLGRSISSALVTWPDVVVVSRCLSLAQAQEKNRKWLQALMTAEEEEEAQLMHEDLEKEYRAKYGRKPELPPLPPSAPLQPQGNSYVRVNVREAGMTMLDWTEDSAGFGRA